MKYSYDEKCLDLARHFFPTQSIAFLEALAQEFQDCVEGREDTDDKTLPIPDFLRNQDNLRAERSGMETPADLVGALQDKVHTDAGPFRAGQSVKETGVRCEKCNSGSDVYPCISCHRPGCPGANRESAP